MGKPKQPPAPDATSKPKGKATATPKASGATTAGKPKAKTRVRS